MDGATDVEGPSAREDRSSAQRRVPVHLRNAPSAAVAAAAPAQAQSASPGAALKPRQHTQHSLDVLAEAALMLE
ncbi:MAG: hypothetical protein WDW38_002451 [Sanguina aurantia]